METHVLDNKIRYNSELSDKVIKELGCIYYDYNKIVSNLIREKYSADDEIAILRQKECKPDEFAEYDTYVESCKTKAKAVWNRQEAAIRRIVKELAKEG